MTHLITYATENMSKAAELCVQSAERNGVHNARIFGEDDISDTFWRFNNDIYQFNARGANCYWLFKPYIIYDEMLRSEDGSYIIYSDAGVEFINSVQHIIDKMDQDIFLFGNNWNHVDWCKGDVIKGIGLNNYQLYNEAIKNQTETQTGVTYSIDFKDSIKQCQASVIFIRNTEFSRKFIKEWLLWCQMPGLIDDSPSTVPNYPGFQEHRHDQAILTCLAIKYEIKMHYWPATYNYGAFNYEKLPCYSSDNYPIIFHHHRKRNNEW